MLIFWCRYIAPIYRIGNSICVLGSTQFWGQIVPGFIQPARRAISYTFAIYASYTVNKVINQLINQYYAELLNAHSLHNLFRAITPEMTVLLHIARAPTSCPGRVGGHNYYPIHTMRVPIITAIPYSQHISKHWPLLRQNCIISLWTAFIMKDNSNW